MYKKLTKVSIIFGAVHKDGLIGLDEIMDGGLAKGELAIILAAWGVGKTTMITKLANHAKATGNNVMQINIIIVMK